MPSLAINEAELEELVNWEIINPSDTDSDDDDVFSLNSWSSEINNPNQNDIPNVVLEHGDDNDDDDDVKRYVIGDDDDDVSDDDDDDDGLDDELVPRYLSGKVGRDRMRKLGKRGFAKMNNAKRGPYSFVKPGCVYGKHGLGFKHCF